LKNAFQSQPICVPLLKTTFENGKSPHGNPALEEEMDASVNETSMLGQRTIFEAGVFVTVALSCWRSCSETPPSLYKTGDPPKSAPRFAIFLRGNRKLAFSLWELKKNIGNCLFPTGNRKRKSEVGFFRPGIQKENRKMQNSDFLFRFPTGKSKLPTFFFNSPPENVKFRYSFSIPGRKKRISGFLFDFPIGKRQILIGNRKFRSEKAKFRFAFQERSLQSRPDVL
jgi:hypothetical protein